MLRSSTYTEYIIQSTEYRTSTRITLALIFHLYPASVGPLSHNQAMCCTKSDSCGLCFPNIPHFFPKPEAATTWPYLSPAGSWEVRDWRLRKQRHLQGSLLQDGKPPTYRAWGWFHLFHLCFKILLFSFLLLSNSCAMQEVVPIMIFLGNEDYLWKYVSRVETTSELVVCKTSFIFFVRLQTQKSQQGPQIIWMKEVSVKCKLSETADTRLVNMRRHWFTCCLKCTSRQLPI